MKKKVTFNKKINSVSTELYPKTTFDQVVSEDGSITLSEKLSQLEAAIAELTNNKNTPVE